jgi:hypothetical protein
MIFSFHGFQRFSVCADALRAARRCCSLIAERDVAAAAVITIDTFLRFSAYAPCRDGEPTPAPAARAICVCCRGTRDTRYFCFTADLLQLRRHILPVSLINFHYIDADAFSFTIYFQISLIIRFIRRLPPPRPPAAQAADSLRSRLRRHCRLSR